MEQQEQAGRAAGRRGHSIPLIAGDISEPLSDLEYDRHGYLCKSPVENPVHRRMGNALEALLMPYLRRRHGDAALVTGNVGLYPREGDRQTWLVPDLLVSRTAGDVGAPGTPADEDRMSYKLWQEPVPDLVLEIVSARSGRRDSRDKPPRYEAMGIAECWVFDRSRRWISTAGGLRSLRLDAAGRYREAPPQAPKADEAAVPPGVVSFWSEALALYLYAHDGTLCLHDPQSGLLKSAEEQAKSAEERIAMLETELRALRRDAG